MHTLVTVVHIFTCILLVLVVLIQSGKGAEISTSFAGSSQTVFGSSGGANFFTRFTSGAAALFMITSLSLTLMGGQSKKSLFETVPAIPITTAPATTTTTTNPAQSTTAPGTVPVNPPAGSAAPVDNAAMTTTGGGSAPAAGSEAAKP